MRLLKKVAFTSCISAVCWLKGADLEKQSEEKQQCTKQQSYRTLIAAHQQGALRVECALCQACAGRKFRKKSAEPTQ